MKAEFELDIVELVRHTEDGHKAMLARWLLEIEVIKEEFTLAGTCLGCIFDINNRHCNMSFLCGTNTVFVPNYSSSKFVRRNGTEKND